VQCIAVQVIWQGAQETNARYSHLQQRREDLFVYSLPLTHARACSPDDAVHRAYHILSAFLLLALHCTAHRPLSRDLSATADLALPVSLTLPRLPACLTCLLLVPRLQPSQPLEVGSRKSEVHMYQNAWTGERSPPCRVHVYLRYRSVWGVVLSGS
jgi:hypothetical protein